MSIELNTIYGIEPKKENALLKNSIRFFREIIKTLTVFSNRKTGETQKKNGGENNPAVRNIVLCYCRAFAAG